MGPSKILDATALVVFIYKTCHRPGGAFISSSSCYITHMQSKCSVNQYISQMNWFCAFKSKEVGWKFNGDSTAKNPCWHNDLSNDLRAKPWKKGQRSQLEIVWVKSYSRKWDPVGLIGKLLEVVKKSAWVEGEGEEEEEKSESSEIKDNGRQSHSLGMQPFPFSSLGRVEIETVMSRD